MKIHLLQGSKDRSIDQSENERQRWIELDRGEDGSNKKMKAKEDGWIFLQWGDQSIGSSEIELEIP